MKAIRKFGAAGVIAGLLASGIPFGAARVEAAGNNRGGDGQTAPCAYLLSVITYPNVNAYIKAYAMALYTSFGCQPALP